MSRNRFENLEPERQTKLFESATEELAEHGYDGASLNRILEKSGMSKSSLYYYFDDKADLFTTMFERAMGYLMREVGGFDLNALTAETYWSEIEALYRRSIALINHNDWFVRLGRVFYRVRNGKKSVAPVERSYALFLRVANTVIQRGQELGVVRTDLPHSMMVDSLMGLGEALDHWVVEHWDEMTPEERFAIVRVQMAMFYRLFAKEAEEVRD